MSRFALWPSLPATNALFDWLSCGITVWLLRLGRKLRGIWPLVCGIGDAFAALIMFFLLSLALCGLIGAINAYRAVPLFDLGALLAEVKYAPGENLWVIAMVVSTLLPTLVHLGIGGLSLLSWFPATLWRALVDRLDPGADALQVPLASSIGLTLILFLYAVIPAGLLYGIGWGLWQIGPEIRIWYVDQLVGILTPWGAL